MYKNLAIAAFAAASLLTGAVHAQETTDEPATMEEALDAITAPCTDVQPRQAFMNCALQEVIKAQGGEAEVNEDGSVTLPLYALAPEAARYLQTKYATLHPDPDDATAADQCVMSAIKGWIEAMAKAQASTAELPNLDGFKAGCEKSTGTKVNKTANLSGIGIKF